MCQILNGFSFHHNLHLFPSGELTVLKINVLSYPLFLKQPERSIKSSMLSVNAEHLSVKGYF